MLPTFDDIEVLPMRTDEAIHKMLVIEDIKKDEELKKTGRPCLQPLQIDVPVDSVELSSPKLSSEPTLISAASQISPFKFDPEHGSTFDVWYDRYKHLLLLHGEGIVEETLAELLRSKLHPSTFARFADAVHPTTPNKLTFDETIEALHQLFGDSTPLFWKRWRAFHLVQKRDEPFEDYAKRASRTIDVAKLDEMELHEFKTMAVLAGLKENSELRASLLVALVKNPSMSLEELKARWKLLALESPDHGCD